MYQTIPAAGATVLAEEVVRNVAGTPTVLAATGIAAGSYLVLASGLMATGLVLRFIARRRAEKA